MERKQLRRVIAVVLAMGIAAGARLRTSHLGHGLHTSGSTHLLVHVCIFGALASLLVFSEPSLRWRWAYFGGVALLGFGTEFHEHLQAHIPIELDDVVADVLGAGVALAVLNAWKEMSEHRLRAQAAQRRSMRRLLREGLHVSHKFGRDV